MGVWYLEDEGRVDDLINGKEMCPKFDQMIVGSPIMVDGES